MNASSATPQPDRPDWTLGLARFVALMSLCVWLGGILFLGAVAAPAISSVDKAHGARILTGLIVGGMLGVFAKVTYVCGVLLVLTWWFERRAVASGLPARLWRTQGIASVLMLALALYVGLVLGPRMHVLQVRLTPQLTLAYQSVPADANVTGVALPGVDPVRKAGFDAMHARYQGLTMLAWWLGLVTLLTFCLRVSYRAERT